MLGTGALAYVGVFMAAAIEGEVVFVAASIAVAAGRLNGWSVLLAGALGGAAGDQFFFYAFRGPLSRWLDRFPRLTRRRDELVGLVRRYAVVLAATSRLLPGLRIAIPVACAYANVPPLLFSVLNMISALVWSASILGLIAWAGPAALTSLGVEGRAAFLLPALLVLIVFIALRRVTFDHHGPPDRLRQGDGGPPIRLRQGYVEPAEASAEAGASAKAEGGHYGPHDSES